WCGCKRSPRTWARGASSSPTSNGCCSTPAPASSAHAMSAAPRRQLRRRGSPASTVRSRRRWWRRRSPIPSEGGKMAIEIVVPALGESVTEATVGQWFKKPGDAVKADEPLVELETDKVTVEVPAPAAGVLGDIKVAQGATVAIGSVLGSIEEAAASPRPKPRGEARPPAAQSPARAPPARPQPPAKSAPAARPAAERSAPAAGPRVGTASDMPPAPAARKLLEEQGMTGADVAGSGRRGQILKEDVIAA